MAEYEACILRMKMVIDMNVYQLLVIGYSDLLTHQVQENGLSKNLKVPLYLQYMRKVCKRFRQIEFK